MKQSKLHMLKDSVAWPISRTVFKQGKEIDELAQLKNTDQTNRHIEDTDLIPMCVQFVRL